MVGVVGSNPIAPTKYQNGTKPSGLFPFFLHSLRAGASAVWEKNTKALQDFEVIERSASKPWRSPSGIETIGVYPGNAANKVLIWRRRPTIKCSD